MMKKIFTLICFLLFLAFAQAQEKAENNELNSKDVTSEMNSILGEIADELEAEKSSNVKNDSEALLESIELSQEVKNKISTYQINSLDHRQEVFSWQLKASKWIFAIVMIIVLSGLALSYMHFYKSLKNPPGAEGEKTELEMSTSGIKMNSSVIGLIILVLAIAFLYLYLIHVFPINEFNLDTNAIPDL